MTRGAPFGRCPGARPRTRLAAVGVWVLALTGCGEDGPTGSAEDTRPGLVLSIVSGDSQLGPPSRLLEEFLVFRVTDGSGLPVRGLSVRWEVVAGGGAVSGKRHDTDLEGLAAGNFTLGPAAGEHVARARVQDSLAVEFTAFAVHAPDEPDAVSRRSPAPR